MFNIWEGTHQLLVTKVVDISKPAEKPAEEIEPDENEDENKQNKSTTRMLQLYLKDSKGAEIKALETEYIEFLTPIKASHTVCLAGPIEVRCGNMMLTKKNVTHVKQDVQLPVDTAPEQESRRVKHQRTEEPPPQPVEEEDVFSDEEPTQAYEPPRTPPVQKATDVKQEVVHIEDWDEEDEEDDDDDCIILD